MKRPKVTDFAETIYRAEAYKYTQEQEKYIDYLEKQNKQLILNGVSHRRELLINFMDWFNVHINSDGILENEIDHFLEETKN